MQKAFDKSWSIGHNWGAFLAACFSLFQPVRVAGIILLKVAYSPPVPNEARFDLDAVLEMTEKNLGRTLFAYWQPFTVPDGPKIVQEHVETLGTALQGTHDGWMKAIYCIRGASRAFLVADNQVPVKYYAKDKDAREAFVSRKQRDEFEVRRAGIEL